MVPRHVVEMIYSYVKAGQYTDLETYNLLYNHLRHRLGKLNLQDLAMLISSFSKIYDLHVSNGKFTDLSHPNFSPEKSVSDLFQVFLIKTKKKKFAGRDEQSLKLIKNTLSKNPKYEKELLLY